MTQVIPVALALIGVTAILAGAMLWLRRLTGHISVPVKNGGLRVITAISVGQDKQLAAVKAGSRNLLIGVTAGGINLICELSEEDMGLIAPELPENGAGSFADILGKRLKKAGSEFIRPYDNKNGENEDGK